MRALLAEHQLNDPDGQVPYSFVRGSRVKRIYVNEDLRRRLLAAEIVVAEVYSSHYLLEPEPLARLTELLPETFVHRADAHGAEGEDEHPVPDDLIW